MDLLKGLLSRRHSGSLLSKVKNLQKSVSKQRSVLVQACSEKLILQVESGHQCWALFCSIIC